MPLATQWARSKASQACLSTLTCDPERKVKVRHVASPRLLMDVVHKIQRGLPSSQPDTVRHGIGNAGVEQPGFGLC